MFETWSIWEAIWSAVALVGMVYSALNVKNGAADLDALKPVTNGRSIVAWGNIRRDSFRLIIQFLYLVIGVWAGQTPNPPEYSLNPSVPVGAVIFITTSFLLTLSAFYDHRDRVTLLRGNLKRERRSGDSKT